MKLTERYSRQFETAAPVLTTRLSSPSKGGKAVSLKVDTGFSGGVLVTPELYADLGFQLFEEPEGSYSGRTAAGFTVPLRASRGSLHLGDTQLECSVFTAPIVVSSLLGLELLNKFRTLLDGPAERLEVELEE